MTRLLPFSKKRSLIAVTQTLLWMTCATWAEAQTGPRVYVGPNIRGGFVDIDAGIRDSIRDIKRQAVTGRWQIAEKSEEAVLVLIVIGRGRITNGSVGLASASLGFGYVVPNEKPTLTTLLKVGSYERVFQSEGGTWTAAADAVVDDLRAWWEANEAAVRESTRR